MTSANTPAAAPITGTVPNAAAASPASAAPTGAVSRPTIRWAAPTRPSSPAGTFRCPYDAHRLFHTTVPAAKTANAKPPGTGCRASANPVNATVSAASTTPSAGTVPSRAASRPDPSAPTTPPTMAAAANSPYPAGGTRNTSSA